MTSNFAYYRNEAVIIVSADDYKGTAEIFLDNGKTKTVPQEELRFR